MKSFSVIANNLNSGGRQLYSGFINFIVFNAVFNNISIKMSYPVHIFMNSWSHFYQCYSQNFYKPLAAFPHSNHGNNEKRRDRNESCRNDYHQSSSPSKHFHDLAQIYGKASHDIWEKVKNNCK